MSNTIFMMMAAAGGVAEQPIDGQTGVWLKAGGVTLSSAMKMTGADVPYQHSQYVYNRGIASNCLISAGGQQFIYSGGVTKACTYFFPVALGYLFAGAAASNCVFWSGGSLRISGGAAATSCIVSGKANATQQGRIIVFNGAAAATEVLDGGRVTVNQGGAIGSNDRISSGGWIDVSSGGQEIGATVFAGGTLTLSLGGYASDVVLSSGASLTVSSGGTALAVTSSAGAVVTVAAGGYIEYA